MLSERFSHWLFYLQWGWGSLVPRGIGISWDHQGHRGHRRVKRWMRSHLSRVRRDNRIWGVRGEAKIHFE